ncbi:MAG: AbrB family transcriptional regulator [Marinosulfonomonas sp.]
MPLTRNLNSAVVTAYTLLAGGIGAFMAYSLSLPIYVLTGPAILVSLLGMTGIKLAVSNVVRNGAFVFVGIGLGSGISAETLQSFLHWPLAFLVLAVMIWGILVVCRDVLMRWFGFDRLSAVLAASPGHLSYVLGLGDALNLDLARISVVQSVRLLALTLTVPVIGLWFGVHMSGNILLPGVPMTLWEMAVLLVLALTVGVILMRFRVPAALMLGGLSVSAVAHAGGWITGAVSPIYGLPAFVVLGTLIGTRFSGVRLADLQSAVGAGLATTLVGTVFAVTCAIPVALALDIPITHVIVAFSPGGLETMVAMGAVLGANPGFVVACHVGRLLMLTVLVPLVLSGRRPFRS